MENIVNIKTEITGTLGKIKLGLLSLSLEFSKYVLPKYIKLFL